MSAAYELKFYVPGAVAIPLPGKEVSEKEYFFFKKEDAVDWRNSHIFDLICIAAKEGNPFLDVTQEQVPCTIISRIAYKLKNFTILAELKEILIT